MKIWLFDIEEKCVINQHAITGLPDLVGSLATIEEQLIYGSYDYIVKIPNKKSAKVKESELNKVNKDDIIMKINIGDSIVKKNGEEAKIILIDYLYRQVEVEFSDGSFEVVDLDKFISKEGSKT